MIIKNFQEFERIINENLSGYDSAIELNENCIYDYKNGINIYLDDVRVLNKHFHICARSFHSMIGLLLLCEKEEIEINIISFDHDLGEETITERLDGQGVAQYIVDYDVPFYQAKFHTSNSVGFENMKGILKNWQEKGESEHKVKIDDLATNSLNYN